MNSSLRLWSIEVSMKVMPASRIALSIVRASSSGTGLPRGAPRTSIAP